MATTIRDEATEAIIALDPKRSAESTLRLIMMRSPSATAAGLFQCPGERLSLFAGCGLTQRDLDRAYAGWEDGRDSIMAGHAYTDDGFTLIPLVEGAVLYLGATPPATAKADARVISQLAPLLLAALREPAAERKPVVMDVEATPTEEFDRERLMVLLQRNEWNIARVARLLEVERSTVYRRMERLGIPRERVRKS